MANRIKAIRSTAGLTLSLLEIIISVVLVIRMFSSDGAITSIAEDVGDVFGRIDAGSSSLAENIDIRGPGAALVLVVGFMVLSFFLVTVLPRLVDKREKEYDEDDSESE